MLRTLVAEPRAEGATRLDPVAFGRLPGMDRSPEAKTVRRQHHGLVDAGKIPELMSMIAFERSEALKAPGSECCELARITSAKTAHVQTPAPQRSF
ncbi:hypothetical protein ACIPVK_21405 [Paeniglutamicibacter sp. MACA_103]|uniref:hypothetical protein n=1 Tax=Paeniglutamicibacter sp. MACA_103 TaxID=3377337 RepID=UPI003893E080